VFVVLTLPTIFLLKRAPLQHAHARGGAPAVTQHAS
jgi:hypothetical protein